MLHLGYDVGGTKVAAGLVDENKRIIAKLSHPFPKGTDGPSFAAFLRRMADGLCREAGISASDVPTIGVGLPGTLDEKRRTVIHAHNLGFHQLPLAGLLGGVFPEAEIKLLNDADAATLAELKAGALQGCRSGLLLTLGTGLGGGIVSRGELFHGGQGRGVELGHMLLHKDGRRCTCGQRGCAERYCSATALALAGRRAITRAPESLLARRAAAKPEKISARDVIDCARAGDSAALAVFDAYVDELASFIASLVNLLDPEVIAIGGGLGQSGEFLCAPLRQRAAEKCFYKSCGRIAPATLGNDAGLIGAALAGCIVG
ncbi:MAG: ROK family protein [Firmicutes bacterium]|nr:ROK family protein [Bacillota bacterium]